jgi:replicative DNA helicase
MGKTAFALTLAGECCHQLRQKGCFLQSGNGWRTTCTAYPLFTRTNRYGKLRSGNLRAEDFQKIPQAAQPIINSSLYIDDNADLGIMELLSKTRSLKSKIGLDLVVVDYCS